ncbi:MAG TPA: 16S rRNA (cytidine(1402)-2'-O)-methyltransferase [Anaerolineales bacterium]|nr:16S rRNA (cytidine(1402)-2'-O)-methyltransferase [Anaerolineales bacterium]
MGTLYLVATPIGNLDDISARALRTLQQVRLIAAEDTRRTRKLLTHFGIKASVTSYYEHNKLIKLDKLLAELANGDIALVSEAGTPGLNDPGYELVRAAIGAGYKVSPVPGPSAPIAALVASGLPSDTFIYLGYLPRKTAERSRLLAQIAEIPYTLIFLEAPHRLLASLYDLEKSLGNRNIAIARELTKIHEEIFRGTISQARAKYAVQEPRGEFTLVVEGCKKPEQIWPAAKIQAVLKEKLTQGESPSRLAAEIADQSGWPRREIYKIITDMKI